MKIVKYDQEVNMVCPVCQKVVLDANEGEIKPCKHVKLWFHNMDDDIVYTSSQFKSARRGDYKTFRKHVKEHGMTVLRYKGEDIGGCFCPVDTIAFQK